MKRVITILAVFVLTFFLSSDIYAQIMGPSNPPGDPQPGDNPIGGGAPIGSGTIFLIGMGAAYAGKKLYHLRKEDLEE